MDLQACKAAALKVIDHAKKHGKIKNVQDCADVPFIFNELFNDSGDKVIDILLKLVKDNFVSRNLLIKECISAAAVGKPLVNCVMLLLHLTSISLETHESIPSQHPLTRVYINNDNKINCILSVIQEFLFAKVGIEAICGKDIQQCLWPFIKYVIENGRHIEVFVISMLDISSAMIWFNENHVAVSIVCHMVSSFKNHKLVQQHANQYLHGLHHIATWFMARNTSLFNGGENSIGFSLVYLLLTCSWYASKNETNMMFKPMFLIKCLIKRADQESCEHVNSGCEYDEVLFICSLMLLENSDTISVQLLEIVNHLITGKSFEQIRYLVMPLLVLSVEDNAAPKSNIIVKKLLTKLLAFHKNTSYQRVTRKSNLEYGKILCHASNTLNLMESFTKNPSLVCPWLKDLEQSCCTNRRIKDYEVTILVDLLFSNDANIYPQLMSALSSILKSETKLVSKLLPVFLYILGEKNFKSVKLVLLHSLPNLAVSKETLPMVLKLIMTLSSNGEMFPVAIHLLVKLWEQQPRVYSYLHQCLSKQINKDSLPVMVWYEWLLSRVTAVWKISKSNATQYGEEMVVILSSMLEEVISINANEQERFQNQLVCVIALLVEALKEISLAMVIGIESIWKAIIFKVLSVYSESSVILQSICSLLSIVPACITSEQSQAFTDEVLQYLWHLTRSKSVQVENAVYHSLSNFQPINLKVKYLPKEVTAIVYEKLQKENLDDESYNAGEEVCPGYAYILLLHTVSPIAYQGFKAVLTNVLEEEIVKLPRGIGKISHIKQSDNLFSELPLILKQQYDTNKRPAVLSGLAAGLLCCFQPSIRGFNANNPSNEHLILLKEKCKQMLESLLNDFTIQQNDWHHMLFAAMSWKHFMQKIILTYEEGREAELEEKKSKGKFTEEEDYVEELKTIFYWVRDSITDTLRKASKGSPKVQGNSVLALVGLASALVSRENNLETKTEPTSQYISMRHWLLKVADTVMLVFDGKYQPKCKPFQWCQQVSSSTSSASSFLSRCAASISFGELVHLLLPIDPERLSTMVDMLKVRLPGQPKSGSSSQMDMFVGIGFGLLLSKLHEEQFQNIAGENTRISLINCLELSRQIVLDKSIENRDGICVGFGLIVSSLLVFDTRKDSQIFALKFFEELKRFIEDFSEDDIAEECIGPLIVAFALITSQAFLTKSISADVFSSCYNLIREKHTDQAPSTYTALGITTCTAFKQSVAIPTSSLTEDIKNWKDILSNRNAKILHKTCALRSLVSLFGIELSFFGNNTLKDLLDISPYLKVIVKLVSVNADDMLSNAASKLIGLVSMVTESSSFGSLAVPSNYDYLKESSMLRCTFAALFEASSTGPYGSFDDQKLSLLLSALINIKCSNLPPVNWTLVISPLVELNYSISAKLLCFQLALKLISKSTNLALWVSSWLQPTTFMKLAYDQQSLLFSHVASILPNIANTSQKTLLKDTPVFLLTQPSGYKNYSEIVFSMWMDAVTMTEPPQSTVSHVLSALKDISDMVTKLSKSDGQENMYLLTKCVYLLLRDNWKSFYENLAINSYVKDLFLLEMCNHVEKLNADDVLLLLNRVNEDLFLRLMEIIFTQRKLSFNFINELLNNLQKRKLNSEEMSPFEDLFLTYLIGFKEDETLCSMPNQFKNAKLFAVQAHARKQLNRYAL